MHVVLWYLFFMGFVYKHADMHVKDLSAWIFVAQNVWSSYKLEIINSKEIGKVVIHICYGIYSAIIVMREIYTSVDSHR